VTPLGAAIARWLQRNQQADGRIMDPLHREHGTYADGFACLAFGLMAQRTSEDHWSGPCQLSLEVARRRPRVSEFDQMALLLLGMEAQKARKGRGRPLIEGTPSDSSADPIRLYRGSRLVSNNWIALRALNYALRARLTDNKADRSEAARLWQQVLGWQLGDGLFVDSPGGQATPITYHAKFCAMLALALSETEVESEKMHAALQRGLAALSGLVSPSGVLVPYGRSRNTLFGYAAGILAFRLGSRLFGEPQYEEIAGRLEGRISHFLRSDGHVPCVLNDGEADKLDWDVYVNNPDYNAYAAALLLLAERVTPHAARGSAGADSSGFRGAPVAEDQKSVIRHIGPVLIVRMGGSFSAFSTWGQTVPFGTPFFCDHRYYGMQPLWIEQNGQTLLEPAPYQWRGTEDRTALVDPRANPWMPYIAVGDTRYCTRRYDRVQVSQRDRLVEVEAEGQPEAYWPLSRWERGLRGLSYPWTGRPLTVFRSRALRESRLGRRISWNPDRGTLNVTDQVLGDLPPAAILEPGVQEWSHRSPTRSAPSRGVLNS
jgi:hypothetical protein